MWEQESLEKEITAYRDNDGSKDMGVLDKFLDIMKLNDDYEDDYDDYDDYEDDYEEKKPRKSVFSKNKDYDDEDDFEEEKPSKSTRATKQSTSNITPIRSTSNKAKNNSNMGVCVIKPTSVDDGREICETLLESRTVILNLEGLDIDIAQRIIDFTSGATFSIDGHLQKISNYIFLVTPGNVDISGDLQDLLGNSFDASSIRSRF